MNKHDISNLKWLQSELSVLSRYKDTTSIPEDECKLLLKAHMEKVPNKLYKYASCDDNKFKTLRKNHIWASRGFIFPDEDDLLIETDIIKLKEAAEKSIELFYLNSLNEILVNIKFPDECIAFYKKVCLDSEYKLIPENEERLLNSSPKGSILYVMITVLRIIRREYTSYDRYVSFLDNSNKFREIANVFCLTERYDNSYMWNNFADGYRGFCIEYDFSNYERLDIEYTSNLLSLLPVIYSNQKILFDPSFLLSYDKEILFSDITSRTNLNLQCYYKRVKFSEEEEWRIIYKRDKEYEAQHGNKGQEVYFPFISKMFLGCKISDSFKKTLMDIAHKFQVEIYQQRFDENTEEMHFESI